uniref:Uncharacterized protein n=1 Tax=Octopus bimaculoides TaxID=37653 RepID=A0A0L8G0F6_OCTBM
MHSSSHCRAALYTHIYNYAACNHREMPQLTAITVPLHRYYNAASAPFTSDTSFVWL